MVKLREDDLVIAVRSATVRRSKGDYRRKHFKCLYKWPGFCTMLIFSGDGCSENAFLSPQSAFTEKPCQGMPALHMDNILQFRRSQAGVRVVDKGLCCVKQIAVAGERDRLEVPKPIRRELNNGLRKLYADMSP